MKQNFSKGQLKSISNNYNRKSIKTNRLKEIDGLRAFAVLGVLWAHCWIFFDNISFTIFRIPVNRIISFGGVGVDLFFVISGFCMYYTFHKKYKSINGEVFIDFVKNRWLRIAPAFYFAVIIYAIDFFIRSGYFPYLSIASNLIFIQTFVHQNLNAPHFWSLATEWHFYVILPVLFYLGNSKVGIYRTVALLMIICLILRLYHWGYVVTSPLSIKDYDRIYFRFLEFGWGLLACKLYLDKISLPKLLLGAKGFIIAFSIAYIGRLMNTTEVINFGGSYGYIIKAFSDLIMTMGFAILLQNSIQSIHIFTKALNSTILQKIGRVSYSFYLWHWIISWYSCKLLISFFGKSNLVFETAFISSAILTYYASVITYNWIELKFYNSQQNTLVLKRVF